MAILVAAVMLLPHTALARRSAPRSLLPGVQTVALKGDPNLVHLKIRDVVPLPEANTHAVVLVSDNGETIVPLFVDEETAVSIAMRLAHKHSPMPLAADLLGDVLNKLGGKLVAVKIDSVVADEYQGRVRVSKNGAEFEMAARPQDALAVAVDTQADVFASRDLVKDVGITRGQIEQLKKAHPQQRGDDEEGVGGSGNAGKDDEELSPPPAPVAKPGKDAKHLPKAVQL